MKFQSFLKGFALAAAAGSVFLTPSVLAKDQTALLMADSGQTLIHCSGVNSCRGQSECATPHNACQGQNSCKGQGWISLTKDECQKLGGQITE